MPYIMLIAEEIIYFAGNAGDPLPNLNLIQQQQGDTGYTAVAVCLLPVPLPVLQSLHTYRRLTGLC